MLLALLLTVSLAPVPSLAAVAFDKDALESDLNATCAERHKWLQDKELEVFQPDTCLKSLKKLLPTFSFESESKVTWSHVGSEIRWLRLSSLKYAPREVNVAAQIQAIRKASCVKEIIPAAQASERYPEWVLKDLRILQPRMDRTLILVVDANVPQEQCLELVRNTLGGDEFFGVVNRTFFPKGSQDAVIRLFR